MHFDDFDAYLLHVERARPGDHLTLFDLDSIAAQAFWRGGAANSSARLHVDDDGWYQLHEMLKDESDEVVVVRRFVGPLTGSMLIDVKELWNPDDDEFAEFRRRFMWGWGEALFFSSQLFDLDSEGNQVKTVTPDGVFRVHSLVDPNVPTLEDSSLWVVATSNRMTCHSRWLAIHARGVVSSVVARLR